ncbi:glycosyltransferase family 4 protein [Rhodococcus globerulus]|uniref:glycosyltransferase family 4 protein n=1 Tax=Rhodococcus globerulus TaxID=33008 RepID=UPI0039E8E5B5
MRFVWEVVGKDDFEETQGGLNRYVQGYLHGLEQIGIDPRLHLAGQSNNALVETQAQGGVLNRMRVMMASGFNARRRVANCDALVVNTHFALYGTPFLLGASLGRLRSPKSNRPVVIVHFHGPWSDESKVAEHAVNRISIFAKRSLEIYGLRAADRVVVLSQVFHDLLVDEYHIPSSKISIQRPGIERSWFGIDRAPSPREQGQSKIIKLIAVRRLTPRMGFLELFNLLESIDFTVDGNPVHLAVVGDGADRTRLTDWIKTHSRERWITLRGRLSDVELRGLMQNSMISIVPTTALEGFGLVVLESMAAGLPVITTGQGGLSEAMGPWNTPEYLFDLRDSDSLSSAIRHGLRASANREEIDSLRAYASGFEWKTVATRIRNLVTETNG